VSAEVLDYLVTQGFNRNLGARPLKEMLEDQVVDPLVQSLLYGQLKDLKTTKKVQAVLVDNKVQLKF
jgi:ATP-dependent Clp protease ATP-binding subunit ClpA